MRCHGQTSWVLVENRRTILRLLKEGVFQWKIRPRNPVSEDVLIATPSVSREGISKNKK